MRVTVKGQVTIPHELREKFGITANSEVDFFEENGRIVIIKIKKPDIQRKRFRSLRGTATVSMTTEEILKLTRGYK